MTINIKLQEKVFESIEFTEIFSLIADKMRSSFHLSLYKELRIVRGRKGILKDLRKCNHRVKSNQMQLDKTVIWFCYIHMKLFNFENGAALVEACYSSFGHALSFCSAS